MFFGFNLPEYWFNINAQERQIFDPCVNNHLTFDRYLSWLKLSVNRLCGSIKINSVTKRFTFEHCIRRPRVRLPIRLLWETNFSKLLTILPPSELHLRPGNRCGYLTHYYYSLLIDMSLRYSIKSLLKWFFQIIIAMLYPIAHQYLCSRYTRAAYYAGSES